MARTTGAAVATVFAGLVLSKPELMNVPFYLAGGLKIIYDLLLYRAFVNHTAPED